MNRRSFFRLLAASPVAASIPALAGPTDVPVKGSSEACKIKIINVYDPSIVGDYLATEEGERFIKNAVRRGLA